jgi:integrase
MRRSHLFKRGDIWFCWFYDPAGKRIKRSTRCRDHRAAEAALKRFERTAQGAPGAAEDAAPYPLEDCLEDFVRDGLHDVADETARFYEEKCGHLRRLLGQVNTHVLGTATIKAYIGERVAEGAARGTVAHELTALRRALGHAREAGRYHFEAKHVIPKFRAPYKPRTRWLTRDEFKALLRELDPHRQLWVVIAVFTGARDSEVDTLSWEHVDWNGRTLTLQGTKTKRSRRRVPLHPLLAELLRRSRGVRGPVVGEWMNINRDLARACERAKISKVTPNDLRRTYTSWLKQDGVDSAIVARLLGHGSTKMVDLVYGQLDDETLSRAVRSLPGAWDTGGTRDCATPAISVIPAMPLSVEESLSSVLGPGIEPGTRGFSIRSQRAPSARIAKRWEKARGRRDRGGTKLIVVR